MSLGSLFGILSGVLHHEYTGLPQWLGANQGQADGLQLSLFRSFCSSPFQEVDSLDKSFSLSD
jgi:hypothetical protein